MNTMLFTGVPTRSYATVHPIQDPRHGWSGRPRNDSTRLDDLLAPQHVKSPPFTEWVRMPPLALCSTGLPITPHIPEMNLDSYTSSSVANAAHSPARNLGP